MKLVTIATHSDGYFPYLKKSCEKFGAELIVLGWGEKWTGYSFKSMLLQNFLKGLPDDEIVCCIDSFDVILLRSIEELEKSFRDFSEMSGARVVVGYDRAVHSIVRVAAEFQFGNCHGYPINAGTYMGYVKELSRMIDMIYSDPKLDDQKLLTDYCRSHPNDIYVDSASIFFLTINNPLGANFYDSNVMSIDKDKRLLYRGVRPFFAHGNGNTNMNELIESLGYSISVSEKQALQNFNKKSKIKKARWYIREFVEQNSCILFIVVLLFIVIALLRRSKTRE
jgi:hypothetical protein